MHDAAADPIEHAGRLLRQAQRVVVLTGAGISTDSGIQDFRGPEGLWTKNPAAERAATIDAYVGDPDVRRRSWRNRLSSPMWDSEPNAGHRALVDLERSGRLDTLVTQNIDGLHQKAGNDPSLVIEIHGTSLDVVCLRCGDRQPCEPVHARVRAGEDDPTCLCPAAVGAGPGTDPPTVCGGILKSATISFGQSLVPEDLIRGGGRGIPVRSAPGRGLDARCLPRRRSCPGGGPAWRGRRDRERRADRDGRPRRRRGARVDQRGVAGAGPSPRRRLTWPYSPGRTRPCLTCPSDSPVPIRRPARTRSGGGYS